MTRAKERRPLFLKRSLAGLVPADHSSEEMLNRIPLGEVVRATVRRPRNMKHHRLYWSMLTLICDNLDRVKPETLHDLIKLRTGHVRVFQTVKGPVEMPGSISFDAMDQAAFREFFDRAVDFIVTDVMPALDRDDLLHELNSMMGRAA